MFGLKRNDIEAIVKVFEAIVKVLQVFPVIEAALIFGSKAMGNYKRGSDIDIAIKGEGVTFDISSKVSYLLNEETPMPYFFLDYHRTSVLFDFCDSVIPDLIRNLVKTASSDEIPNQVRND